MDPLRPETRAGPGTDAQARLRLALAEALRARDMIAVSALRSALGAIGNAEAVEPGAATPAGPGSPHVAGAVAGLGSAEAERRRLSAAEIEQIVRGEAGEREGAARDYERAGHADRAGRFAARRRYCWRCWRMRTARPVTGVTGPPVTDVAGWGKPGW